jgi:hypothetical protein
LRIDSHVCFSESHPPEHLKAILQRNRFDGAILVVDRLPVPAVQPHILGLVVRDGAVDSQALVRYQAHAAFRGICCSPASLSPVAALDLAQRGVPLDVEMGPGDFPDLLRLAGHAPELRMVIDHLARPVFQQGITEEWDRGMEAAARLPRIFCKLSGLLTGVAQLPWSAAPVKPFVQRALALFGPRRLMFGSEWPLRLPDITWKESLAAFTQSIGAHSMEDREQLLGETARTFYRIA